MARGLVVGMGLLLAAPSLAYLPNTLPSCWVRHGECLDLNQPPLDMSGRIKPQINQNVVAAIQNVASLDACMSKCELYEDCQYFTLYKENLGKDCHLVGFNLGTSCSRLANVCVLHRECYMFNATCGEDCPTARRSAKWDLKDDAKTIIVGGVRRPRLKLDEYATKVEVHDDLGQLDCPRDPTTVGREGAAGGLWARQRLLWCGGWHTSNISASDKFTGELAGSYLSSCETMEREGDWTASSGLAMKEPRAFFPMVETPYGLYAIGGYNEASGMLRTIERYDGTTWETLTDAQLADAKSHSCGVHVPLTNRSLIFVIGGWTATLEYVPDVEVFEVHLNGSLEVVAHTLQLPSDRDEDMKFAGKADLHCQHFRKGGWQDGILISGGYRSAGAWLNTAWFLDLQEFKVWPTYLDLAALTPQMLEVLEGGKASNSTVAMEKPSRWATRLTDISREFVDGRHFHQGMVAGLRPMLLGGWSNQALGSKLQFDDCSVNEEDPTRLGVWTEYQDAMVMGREKFSAITVPADFLISSNIRC